MCPVFTLDLASVQSVHMEPLPSWISQGAPSARANRCMTYLLDMHHALSAHVSPDSVRCTSSNCAVFYQCTQTQMFPLAARTTHRSTACTKPYVWSLAHKLFSGLSEKLRVGDTVGIKVRVKFIHMRKIQPTRPFGVPQHPCIRNFTLSEG